MKFLFPILFCLFSFTFCSFAQVLEPLELETVVRVDSSRRLISYSPIREADVMWQRRIWRVVDLREKINQYLYFPLEHSFNRSNLFSLISNGIRSKSLQPYDPFYDDFTRPITHEQALSIGLDTLFYEDHIPTPPYDLVSVIRIDSLDPASIKKFFIKEDWVFDKARSEMTVRILGICPVREIRNEFGEILGEQMMYWIYFPELRHILSQNAIYNKHNKAYSLSYDDAFMKRMFSSYIYKEDNVFNRSISDYNNVGMEAYLESEFLKEKIRNFESDLWEY